MMLVCGGSSSVCWEGWVFWVMVGVLPKMNHRHVTAMALAVLKEKRAEDCFPNFPIIKTSSVKKKAGEKCIFAIYLRILFF